MALAMAPSSIKYEFESVLRDITPENPPTNPSPNNPRFIIQLRYTHRWLLRFQSEDGNDDEDEEFIENFTPEFSFLLCISLDRLNEGGYISHVLQRDCGVHLQPRECDHLKAQIAAFAPSLLLAKSDVKHQVIHMAIFLQVTKVECIHDDEFAESENQHDDNEEFTVDNFGFSVSV